MLGYLVLKIRNKVLRNEAVLYIELGDISIIAIFSLTIYIAGTNLSDNIVADDIPQLSSYF